MPSAGGGGGGDDRLEVDPDVLIRAGQRLGVIGSQLGKVSDSATPTLESGIASGWDPAGLNFGLQYSDSAGQLAQALAAAANGCKALGQMLEASGYNYKNADAQSTIGGSGPAGGVSGQPSETKSASIPSWPNGTGVLPPPMFLLVCGFFGGPTAWPLGDPPMLRLLAAQWELIGKGLGAFDDDIAAIKTTTSTQHVPEHDKIQEKLTNLTSGLKASAKNASELAQQIKTFADGVEKTQNAIRRLLERISPENLLDTVTDLFTGKTTEILRDIEQVLKNYQNQIKGIVGLLGQLGDAIGDALTELQKLVRPYLVAVFGDEIGNALANTYDFVTDFQVGLITGLLNTVAGTVALFDAETWQGMYRTAMSVVEDPSKLDDVLLNMGKGFIAYDKITGDHPGRGVGEAAFNIGSLFVPGGAMSKTGTLAKGIRYGNKLLDEGRVPRIGDLPGVKDKTPSLGSGTGAGGKLPDVPEIRPGAVPDSVLAGPRAPEGINAPSAPRELAGPAGPPDPPGPHSIRGDGGGGPPPDPPGRPVAPPDHGPSHTSGTTAQSPAPSSGHSPNASEPSAPTHTPSKSDAQSPAAPHTPQSSTPTGTHDSSRSPSEPSQSPPGHGAPTPETSTNGHSAGQHGGGPGLADNAQHRTPSPEHGTGHEGQTHAPTEHQPAHTPRAEQPSTHERTTTDGGQVREQPHTPGARDGTTDQPAANAPGTTGGPMTPTHMAGTHAPPPSHAPAATHTPDGSSTRTPTAEATDRRPEAKAPQASTSDSSRTQSSRASGPQLGESASPPVRPINSSDIPVGGGEPLRPVSPNPRPGEHSPPAQRGPYESVGPQEAERPGSQAEPNHGPNDRLPVDEPAKPGIGARESHNSGSNHAGRTEADHHDEHPTDQDGTHQPADSSSSDRYVELEDGSLHKIWSSNEQLRAQDSRFAAAHTWLADRGLTRADIQPLLVQPADWLNATQRDLVYGFRHEFSDAAGEPLQKIIDEGQADFRLEGGSDKFPPSRTGGSVSVARDTHDLDTPARIYDGLSLEYDGTPFSPERSVVAMRFTADEDVAVHVPDQQLSERAGHGPSYDPGYPYPFTGTGFTASDHFAVPEYFLDGGTVMNPGAEMYRIEVDGREQLVAVLDSEGKWIQVKRDG